MRIAVEGCMHGELDKVYETIREIERFHNIKIDLLLCCGDFQAVRNKKDLESMSIPSKYHEMGCFWKYYSGEKVAPIPTIFIGGNHEASNYLWELYYGGWVAPNIYYMGSCGVIKFGNLRIGGLSGIYNAHNYKLGHFERPPFVKSDHLHNNEKRRTCEKDDEQIRSVYHVREYEVLKLMQLEDPIDIFLSHDWPVGITDCGNWRDLVKKKPYFEREIREKSLGSKPAAMLLDKLKPSYWFSAHLHCQFSALVQHQNSNGNASVGPVTRFLALDKCLPGRKFLQIIELPLLETAEPLEIHYDEEWLGITRALHSAFPLTKRGVDLSSMQITDKQGIREWVKNKLKTRGGKPFDFAPTAPYYDPKACKLSIPIVDEHHRNPQTEALLYLLDLPYLLDN